MNIEETVKQVVCEQLRLVDGYYEQNKDTDIRELGADSLDEVELIMTFEEETGYEFPDEEAEKVRTPNQMIAYLKEKLG